MAEVSVVGSDDVDEGGGGTDETEESIGEGFAGEAPDASPLEIGCCGCCGCCDCCFSEAPPPPPMGLLGDIRDEDGCCC